MKENIINILSCPECENDLQVIKIINLVRYYANDMEIKDGILKCISCNSFFPIINKIPRLVLQKELTLFEKNKLDQFKKFDLKNPKIINEIISDKNNRHKIIEKILKKDLYKKKFPSDKLKKRAEHDIEYRIFHTEDKQKFVNTVLPFMKKSPEIIVDLGGGQGGTISCFKQFFNPQIAILVDLNLTWVEIAKLRDPYTEIIRANAERLPLKENSVELLITTSALEHIPVWKESLNEITRVSKNAFIVWGPNKWFLYDWGHLDAPFVTFLPKKLGVLVAYIFHFLRRTKRSYYSIKQEMNSTFFISRQMVKKNLEKNGIVYNVFTEFIFNSVEADYHYIGGKIKRFLKNHPILLKIICCFLIKFRMEPMCYLFFMKKKAL